jgi:hypothetical protein
VKTVAVPTVKLDQVGVADPLTNATRAVVY